VRIGKSRGSFLPVLMKLVQKTTGPILELGMGFCSSPYLHWACYPTKRRLVSYENNPGYHPFAESWKDTFHEIHCVENWNDVDLSELWTIAFLDHEGTIRNGHLRSEELPKVCHADFVIAHDTDNRSNRKYKWYRHNRLFKYRYKYDGAYPHTTVWSNRHDVRDFKI
jgi:hypothetical protein